MAKPNKKLPECVVKIVCAGCGAKLFKYHKNGKGALVKCFKERVAVDYCENACYCPNCHQMFAREQIIRGAAAYKIIGGKARID